MNIGEAIKLVRKKQNITQVKLAQKTGIAQPHISAMEKGKKEPSGKNMARISKALKIPVQMFYFLTIEKRIVPKEKKLLYDKLFLVMQELILMISQK